MILKTRTVFYLITCFFLVLALNGKSTEIHKLPADQYEVQLPEIIVRHISAKITIKKIHAEPDTPGRFTHVLVNSTVYPVQFENGFARIPYTFTDSEKLVITIDDYLFEKDVSPIPLWMSILPPLIAILFALIFREVFSALFTGLMVGTTIIAYYSGSTFIIAVFQGILSVADTYILESIQKRSHLSIIIFSMLIGAMVHLIGRNGGMKDIINKLNRYATNSVSGQFATWIMGVLIFFDDYANTLVVGNTMRPMTDRLRISREKLAYLVDSTAAPVAAIAFISTWIGAELSYIEDGIKTIGIDASPYAIFVNSLAYSFYPIFALIFILFLIFRKVDFGPMVRAEQKARAGEINEMNLTQQGFSSQMHDLELPDKVKPRWFNAVIPVLVIVFGTIAGLLYTGWDNALWASADLSYSQKIAVIVGQSDSYKALLWSSISGVMAAVLLTMGQRILNLKETIDSLVSGFKTMLTAVLILILAWSLALITEHLHTADFISQSMLSISLSPYLVPAITFILAALVSFSTGSSWGTMAILYPLLLPASWLIAVDNGLDEQSTLAIFYNVVSGVLAGSVLGDHCSPISDTTILSSLASSCNHIEHVRTQLPYALTVGAVSILIGTIPTAYGFSSILSFLIGLITLFVIVLIFGKKIPVYKYQQ
ncbi:MAG: Na+/H+ antiporter NhaC family protein [Bacteroidota bacterium]|nr:Na+/H+ antiporter NhaC family protein [Bacteroidota bacterium]